MAWSLETERLRLRHFTVDDVPAILALFSDPEVNTFLPWWPLKDFTVVFRMYQRNFCVAQDFVFKKYWEQSTERMIEEL